MCSEEIFLFSMSMATLNSCMFKVYESLNFRKKNTFLFENWNRVSVLQCKGLVVHTVVKSHII